MRFIFSSARAMRSLLVPRELTCATCAFSLRIRTERMTLLAWIAAVVLFLQLPIPLYWFVLHPARNFWSARRNAAYIVALALSWLPVTLLLIAYHRHLLRPRSEEHTSELQSHVNLVCRLLLEKIKSSHSSSPCTPLIT